MASNDEFVEFENNPYNPESHGPEEIVRLFYRNDVPILPVVSKRGLLLGILTKEKVISELSDLERVGRQKIDAFIMKIAKKMSLDDLLPVVGNVKEFVIINLFGEPCGSWSRLELFSACEAKGKGGAPEKEAEKQREEHVLEWMIYLVLEHIPRPLYALNEKGKTFFYNSHFEDIFTGTLGKDIDAEFVEKSIANPDRNDFYYRDKNKKDKKDIYFYNKDMKFFYEKITFVSNNKKVGFLIFVDNSLGAGRPAIPGIDMESMPLNEMLESVERSIIVETIRQNKNDISRTASKLKVTKKYLENKIEKHGINL